LVKDIFTLKKDGAKRHQQIFNFQFRLIIDFGLGQPTDIAYLKTIGSFADGDRCLSDPQTLNHYVGFRMLSNFGNPFAQVDFASSTG